MQSNIFMFSQSFFNYINITFDCYEMKEVTCEWYKGAVVFRVFIFFLFRINGKREQLNESNFRCCYGNFFPKVSFRKCLITAMFKVLSQQLQGTLTAEFEKHLTIEDFTDMDEERCRSCTKTFDLLLYASLSLKRV